VCACSGFQSKNTLCVVCDKPIEAHQTLWETARERSQLGLKIEAEYMPLADQPELARLLWEDGSPEGLEKAKAILTGIMMGTPGNPRNALGGPAPPRKRIEPAPASAAGAGAREAPSGSTMVVPRPTARSSPGPSSSSRIETQDPCPHCGFLPPGPPKKFCGECGAKL
jgi:hypothetical protein